MNFVEKFMGEKFKITSLTTGWAAAQFRDCNVFYVNSAVAVAAPIAQVSRQTLLEAVRVGSLHAHSFNYAWGDDGMMGNYDNRGRAARFAFHVDSISSWAQDHTAARAQSRFENAARLNQRFAVGSGSCIP